MGHLLKDENNHRYTPKVGPAICQQAQSLSVLHDNTGYTSVVPLVALI